MWIFWRGFSLIKEIFSFVETALLISLQYFYQPDGLYRVQKTQEIFN